MDVAPELRYRSSTQVGILSLVRRILVRVFGRLQFRRRGDTMRSVGSNAGTPEEKLAELILFVAREAGGSVGATKLNKLLYFSDFSAMRRLGHPITGVEYRRLEFGPAPRGLQEVRAKLTTMKAAVLEEGFDAFGHPTLELRPLRDPDLGYFSQEEVQLVQEVVAQLQAMTAAQVSELSHREAGWQLVPAGETIPYELALVLAPELAHPTAAVLHEGRRVRAQYAGRLVPCRDDG